MGVAKRAAALVLLGVFALTAPAAARDDAAAPFLGRWDVTLATPERDYASWLDVVRDQGGVKVRMVGRWGHARWLPQAEIRDGGLRFVSPHEDEGRADDMIFEARRSGDALVGATSGPDGTPWSWRAERAPSLARPQAPHWGAPIRLFDGETLTGWTLIDPSRATWTAQGGVLHSAGDGSDLRSATTFTDFKLHLEFNCAPGANSGVYLRGRYEVQIEDDAAPEGPNMRTAGVYGFLAPHPAAVRRSGVWRSYDITLVGRRVSVMLDGRTLIRNAIIPGVTGGALDSHEGLPGPIMLQGSEAGQVAYRNIVITPALSP